MASVKDTHTFVQASIAIHGRRYDYSLSEWNGASSKIIVICRVCGPFEITADSHYRKGCGCRECALKSKARREGSYQVCPCCRKWAKYRQTGRYCRECVRRGDAGQLRRKLYEQKMTRQCLRCGDTFFAKRLKQKYCGGVCSRLGQSQVIEDQCCVCAKAVKRHASALKKRDRFCCSLNCQRQLALVENKGCPPCDWISRSREAKKRWKISQSKLRKKRSFGATLHRIASKKLKDPGCRVSIATRLSGIASINAHRKHLGATGYRIHGENKQKTLGSVLQSLSRRPKETCKMKKKLADLASSQHKRMHRKSQAKRSKRCLINSKASAITLVCK